MVAAGVQDIIVNPNNIAQRYVMWSNGRVDAVGGAPPITSGPTWFDRLDQPVGVAIWITNWSTGAGYILDYQGGFQPLNGAPAITNVGSGSTTNSNGLPYQPVRSYVDWSWDPAQTGQGYALDHWGQLFPFGGATNPPRTGPRWTVPVARRLEMQWGATKRALTLDYMGGLQADFSAVGVAIGPYWAGQDVARDFRVTDWTGAANGGPKGYVLDKFGAAQPFGGAQSSAFGGPYFPGSDRARTLYVLSPSNPLKFWQVHAGGQQYEYVASGPPTVTAGGGTTLSPADPTTSTTRPTLAWGYSDPDRDLQARAKVQLFTQAVVNANSGLAANPAAYAKLATFTADVTDPNARGVVPDSDLANGAWRYYVQVQDTAGQWSSWATRGWTQNVPVPATPTDLTATVDSSAYSVALSVSATTGGSATLIRFDGSNDGGVTWAPVRGAEAVPLTATTTATDYDAPLGVVRQYRAVAYSTAPRTASAPSSTVTATVTGVAYILRSTADPTVGGVVSLQGAADWTRPVVAGVFQGVGASFVTVVSDGIPKGRRLTLHVIADGPDEWALLKGLINANATLVYRGPLGEVVYCRLIGDVGGSRPVPAQNLHLVDLPLVEVAQPVAVS